MQYAKSPILGEEIRRGSSLLVGCLIQENVSLKGATPKKWDFEIFLWNCSQYNLEPLSSVPQQI